MQPLRLSVSRSPLLRRLLATLAIVDRWPRTCADFRILPAQKSEATYSEASDFVVVAWPLVNGNAMHL